MRFRDKVVIVTGGGQGIGQGTAQLFAEEGAAVVVVDIDTASAQETVEGLLKLGQRALAFHADLTDGKQVEEMIRKVTDTFGRIDILINNVGGTFGTSPSIEEVSEEEWDRVIVINLKSTFLCTQAVIREMKKYGGKIVNVSSISARRRRTLTGPQYSSAKAAIIGFTKHVAAEVGRYGINVNAIAPGFTLSPHLKKKWEEMEETEKRMFLSEIPLGRVAEVKDQAKVVLFLCSEDASYITGATIDVNGGAFML